ncbi:MAG TPA: hypothetical protein VG893_03175 [Terracidiphilus sp.]|nr:hypothetical protein [Terracidiphilus sp.]
MTPNLAVIRIEGNRWWGFPIVLPLFLLWIPAILLAPFVLAVLAVACLVFDVGFGRAVATFWGILCGLSGTDVRVSVDGKRVKVRIL